MRENWKNMQKKHCIEVEKRSKNIILVIFILIVESCIILNRNFMIEK